MEQHTTSAVTPDLLEALAEENKRLEQALFSRDRELYEARFFVTLLGHIAALLALLCFLIVASASDKFGRQPLSGKAIHQGCLGTVPEPLRTQTMQNGRVRAVFGPLDPADARCLEHPLPR